MRLNGAKFRRDKTGLITITVPWEVYSPDDCNSFVPTESAPLGLLITDRSADESEVGTWLLVLTYEGRVGPQQPTEIVVELDSSMAQDPIESHPNFDAIGESVFAINCGCPPRTKQNVIDSDGTAIISVVAKLSRGSALTARLAARHGKPWVHIHAGPKIRVSRSCSSSSGMKSKLSMSLARAHRVRRMLPGSLSGYCLRRSARKRCSHSISCGDLPERFLDVARRSLRGQRSDLLFAQTDPRAF
jgi:hypothetical protein